MSPLKKTFLKAAAVLGIVFATAAGIEVNGYNAFDREDGSNILCQIDPDCRRLTTGEITMAREIFDDTLDYRHIKVFNRWPFILPVPESPKVVMRMWNKNIYAIDSEYKVPDYSLVDNKEIEASSIHELFHIWQYTYDPKFLTRGILSFLDHDLDYNSLYFHNIDDHRKFSDFNFEQQAEIVENYHWYKHLFHKKTQGMILEDPSYFNKTFNRRTRNLCKKLDKYTEMVSQALPQPYEPGCAMYRPYEKPQPDPYPVDTPNPS